VGRGKFAVISVHGNDFVMPFGATPAFFSTNPGLGGRKRPKWQVKDGARCQISNGIEHLVETAITFSIVQ